MNHVDPPAAADAYHRWYYDQGIWEKVRWRGVPCLKSVSDLWNYQEILWELKPELIIEFGTRHGGSALYFADVGVLVRPDCRVVSVDVESAGIDILARTHPAIELWTGSSTEPALLERLGRLRREKQQPKGTRRPPQCLPLQNRSQDRGRPNQ
jgi:cephalosporin hydroxylase